jgi:hypothetical protein
LFDPRLGGGLPAIETEQPAEPFTTNDATGAGQVLLFTVDQSIPQALMVTFVVVVRYVLRDGQSQVVFAQRHRSFEALALDREHKSLRECVQIRTHRRQPHCLHAAFFQHLPKRRRVQRCCERRHSHEFRTQERPPQDH